MGRENFLEKPQKNFNRTKSVILELFCNGIQKAKPSSIVLTSILELLFTPISIAIAILTKAMDLLLMLGVTFLLSMITSYYDQSDMLWVSFLVIGTFLILRADLADITLGILLDLLTIATGGSALKHLARKYLSDSLLANIFRTEAMQTLVSSHLNALPDEYREECQRFFALNGAAVTEEKKIELNKEIDLFWSDCVFWRR